MGAHKMFFQGNLLMKYDKGGTMKKKGTIWNCAEEAKQWIM